MSTIVYELELPRRSSKAPSNVVTLPGAPLRTLDGRLVSELSEHDLMIEFMKRRIMRDPSLFADFKDQERD